MASVDDVARYMLRSRSMTAMKLQKLVYYAQAWHLAETETPLFDEPIEAWANGPVVRSLYDQHRGQFSLTWWPSGDADALTATERAVVDGVLETYGAKSAQWLSEQTHAELPWKDARRGVPPGVRSSADIDLGTMRRFYQREAAEDRTPAAVVQRP